MSDNNTTNNAGQNTQNTQGQQAAPAGQKPQGNPQGKKNKGIRK